MDGVVYMKKHGIMMPLYETEKEVLECFMESARKRRDQ